MMSKVNLAPIEITIDASEAMKQVGELIKLLKLPARSFQGIPEHVVNLFSNRVRGLINNIVPGNLSTAFSTKDINEICIKVKIVSLSNISLPQSGQTAFIVCMNISFLLLGSLKIKQIHAVGEWHGSRVDHKQLTGLQAYVREQCLK
jgi:hypothetical protein